MGFYVRHPLSLEHDTGPHPENAGRIEAIEAELGPRGWLGLEPVEASEATLDELGRVHDPAHVDRVRRACEAGGGALDADTIVSARSFDAALRSAGGALWAAERLVRGEAELAVCAMRPPGHHAESARAMGFCLFNNVAVAAAHVLEATAAERVLVLDWDVHHGNGTQEIFEATDRVLFASIHQWPLYPGTGSSGEIGHGDGEGYTINMPVAPGSGDAELLALVQHLVVPVAQSFRPGLIIVSAGFDAHREDPLANLEVTTRGFGQLARSVGAVARELGVGVLVNLEGGYAPAALAASMRETIEGLTGGEEPEAAPREPADELIALHRERWTALA